MKSPNTVNQGRRMTPRGSLFRKYVVYFVSMVSVALVASGVVGLYYTFEESKSALLTLQREKAAAAASRIDAYVQEIEHQLGWMRLPQIGGASLEQRRVDYLKLLRQVPAITDVSFLDASGHEQLRVSRLGMDVAGSQADLSQDPKFTGTKGGTTYFSAVYFRKETEPYMTIAVRGAGDAGGVTVAEVNLKFIWDVISRIKIGEKGLAYAVDSRGQLIAHPDISQVLQKSDMSSLPQVRAAREAKGGEDSQQVAIAHNLKGEEVLTAFASIAPLGWHVFVEQPLAEAFAPLYASLLRTGLLLLAGLALALAVSPYVARRMVNPIQMIRAGAAQIATGRLDQRIEVRTGDELEALAAEFNNMAKQLEESYSGLERKVVERTKELTEALEQQTATAEILRVISSSPTNIQPVLDAVVESAARLCGASDAVIRLVEGDKLRFGAHHGSIPVPHEAFPITRNRVGGRAVLESRTIHVHDIVEAAADYPEARELQRAGGYRTILGAPLLREGVAIGMILIRRMEVRPFSEKQIALLETFASQAVIAIENVRLFNETKEALERQTATADILGVISSSPTDIKPVLDAVAERAARLCDATDVTIRRVEGDMMHLAAHIGTILPGADARPISRESIPGRAIIERRTIQVTDTAAPDTQEEYPDMNRRGDYRTALAVPLVRDDVAIGVIIVRRAETREFTDQQVNLMKTFSDQAVIAMENVRLFNETKEALEQQTVISDILRAISSSPTDTQPVFDAIVKSAVPLFGGLAVTLRLVKGDHSELVASTNPIDDTGANPLPLDDDSTPGARAMQRREVVRVPNILAEEWVSASMKQRARERGFRALICAPILREDNAIGSINVTRAAPGAFTDKQVALLKTFASQAVIAIENVRLFNEIQDKSRELEVANRHKSEFLANMSHELRTPLNAVIGFSEVLAQKMFGEVNEKQLDYLNDINSSGQHLLSLINDILDLSKIEAGRMELDFARFDLPQAIDNALTLIRERATRHGIALSQELDPALGECVADARKFKQIMLNLLSNAVKFTPEGGRITVRARRTGGAVEISVSDTGIGIAAADQPRVFEEFRQASGDYLKKSEGTGLGLALTRNFVELHGGRISLESEVGKGSTFTFTLPHRVMEAA